MSKSTQNLTFHGSNHDVEIYDDGLMVLHKSTDKTGSRLYHLSSLGGAHELTTLHELKIEIVAGPVEIAISPRGPKKAFTSKGTFKAPPGATFTLKSKGAALLRLIPKPGPGLGSDDEQNKILD